MATHFSILVCRVPVDKGAWWAVVRGVAKSQTLLSDLPQHNTAKQREILLCKKGLRNLRPQAIDRFE